MLTDARIMAIVPTTDLVRARAFYGQTLGLSESDASLPGPWAIYRCGGGTLRELYERPSAGEAQQTLASWEVDGISSRGDFQEAWFRDPDGNILRVHSGIEP